MMAFPTAKQDNKWAGGQNSGNRGKGEQWLINNC